MAENPVPTTPTDSTEPQNGSDRDHHDKIIAYATIAIAVAAVFTMVVGIAQWCALQNQVAEMRRAYLLAVIAKQPSVQINAINTKDPLLGRKTPIDTPILIGFGNAGDSIAIVREIAFEWIEVDTLPTVPVYSHRRKYGTAIKPTTDDKFIKVIFDDHNPMHLSAEQIAGINAGRLHLWVYGMLVSRDIFDRTETFRFCGEWVGPPVGTIESFTDRDCPEAYLKRDSYK